MKKHLENYILIEEVFYLVFYRIIKKYERFSLLIDCFLAKGQIIFAIQDYEQALELMPNNNEIKLRISSVYFDNAERQYKEKRYQVL